MNELKLQDNAKFNYLLDEQIHTLLSNDDIQAQAFYYNLAPGLVIYIENILNGEEIIQLNEFFSQIELRPVGISGNAGQYAPGEIVSSYRASCYDEIYSMLITKRLKNLIPNQRQFNQDDYSVEDNISKYELVGINAYNRFIEYEKTGKLIDHYDGQYSLNEEYTTLMTSLLYLSSCESGHTVFLEDEQKHLPIHLRLAVKHHARSTILSIQPKAGSMVLFDQQLLHTTGSLLNETKRLILSDLIYKKVV